MKEKQKKTFRCLILRPQLRSRNQIKYFSEKLFLKKKNYITSEEAVSHNVFYQQLSSARYQVSFYAETYVSKLPIVSSACYC